MMNESFQGSYYDNQQGGKQSIGMNYAVDMVLCIDATGSMESEAGAQQRIINMVKQNAVNLYSDISKKMKEKNKPMVQLRVRIIVFRDYFFDGDAAMLATDFFVLPDQAKEFEECIFGIKAKGGGDPEEDGLEALAYAIKSKWTQIASKKRQVIVVWTDAGTHELGFGKSTPEHPTCYPKGMPRDLKELGDWWDDMDSYAKRLVLFAPDYDYWNYISENWDNVVHVPSVAGNGLAEQDYNEILEVITNTI